MIRVLVTVFLCAAVVFGADLLFRTSMLRQVRPVITSPTDQAVLEPPVRLSWEGPAHMRVRLAVAGEAARDLGIHASPVELPATDFPRDGGYRVQIEALRFGGWIQGARLFQVHVAAPAIAAEDMHPAPARGFNAGELLRALAAARTARAKAQGRTKMLSEENAALREESDRLGKQLESIDQQQQDDADQINELQRRLAQLAEENRALADENGALRLRLGSVVPCTVWGYYNTPQLQTIPPTLRQLVVSDPSGQIFRAQVQCEALRHRDPVALSVCFCVGNSWGG